MNPTVSEVEGKNVEQDEERDVWEAEVEEMRE